MHLHLWGIFPATGASLGQGRVNRGSLAWQDDGHGSVAEEETCGLVRENKATDILFLMLCHVMLCCVAMLCYVMFCYVVLSCFVMI